MSKDLLYRPDLSYEKSYYTDGKKYDFNQEQDNINNDSSTHLNNRLDNIKDILDDIISKLPAIPTDLLNTFLPSFIVINDVLKDLIDNKDDIPTITYPESPEIIPINPPTETNPIPDPDKVPSDPFGIEDDIYIDIKPGDIDTEKEIERQYTYDLLDILHDYIIKYNNVLDKYIINVMTSLSLSEHSNLKVIATKDLDDTNLSHVTDYLTKSKISLKQQLRLYYKMFDTDETIFHIRSSKIAKEQLKRYKSNEKLKDENALTKSANDLLRESILVAEKKYEENFYGLYKYLNSSVILFNECTNTTIKQKQALVLLNNKEREK